MATPARDHVPAAVMRWIAAIAAIAAGGALVAAAGCAGKVAPRARAPLLETALGPTLELLWDRHGGIERWSQFRGASLRYEGEGPGGWVRFERVLIPFGEPGVIYVEESDTPAPDSPAPRTSGGGELATVPRRWRRLDLESAGGPADPHLDFALRSLRLLFDLPLALGSRDWLLRARATPDVVGDANPPLLEFEASWARGGPLGPFLVPEDELHAIAAEPARRLDVVYYLARHPLSDGGAHEVRFGDWVLVGGLPIATWREHRLRSPGALPPPASPFELPARARSRRFWTERLTAIELLDASAMVAALVGR